MRFVALSQVAPAIASSVRPAADEIVWHLTLDQIVSGTGGIENRVYAPASEAGSSTFFFDKGNVLYSKLRPYLNKVVCPDSCGIATTELIPLRPDPQKLNREYLCHYLRSPKFVTWVNSQAAGAKMPRVNMKSFWSHEIPLPSLADQIRIAHLLSKAEGLIAQREQHLQQLDDLLKSVFLEMFGDIKAKKSVHEWEKPRPYLKANSGKSSNKVKSSEETSFPIYGGNGVNGWASKPLYNEPVIIAGRVGQQCGIIHVSKGPCWVTDNAIAIMIKDHSKLDTTYLATAFQHAPIREKVKQLDLPFINQSMLLDYPIPIPPFVLQKQFAAIVEKIENVKSRYHQSLAGLENLYGALSQKAFKGELDLSRVFLATELMETTVAMKPVAPVSTEEEHELAMEMQAQDELPSRTGEERKRLFGHWLDEYLKELGGAAFYAGQFMEVAQQRLSELAEDEEPEWGMAEYDQLKAWLFQALENGRLTQIYDDAGNCVQIISVKGR